MVVSVTANCLVICFMLYILPLFQISIVVFCRFIAKTLYRDDNDEVTSQNNITAVEPKLIGLHPGSNDKVLLVLILLLLICEMNVHHLKRSLFTYRFSWRRDLMVSIFSSVRIVRDACRKEPLFPKCVYTSLACICECLSYPSTLFGCKYVKD